MNVRYVVFIIYIGLFGEISAALPPYFQGKREIEAILSNSDLAQLIPSGDVIEEIRKTNTGYMVITNKRIVLVTVRYLEEKRPGPAQFVLEFSAPIQFDATSRE